MNEQRLARKNARQCPLYCHGAAGNWFGTAPATVEPSRWFLMPLIEVPASFAIVRTVRCFGKARPRSGMLGTVLAMNAMAATSFR